MKKISLLCATLLACSGLVACGTQPSSSQATNSSKISKLKAENLSLKAKKHHKHKTHTQQSKKKTTKNSQSNSSSSQSSIKNSSSTNSNKNSNNSHSNDTQQTASSNDDNIPESYKENMRKGLEWDGTRKRSSFNSDADYQRYNAWHQGYNYDPSTGQYSPMNQDQLNQMRASMNRDGGQDFK